MIGVQQWQFTRDEKKAKLDTRERVRQHKIKLLREASEELDREASARNGFPIPPPGPATATTAATAASQPPAAVTQ